MSEYTPTVATFRGAYGQMFSEWRRDDALAEFDRFIARIKAEAWDEGYAAGQTDDEFEATNPYREEEGL